MAKAAKDLTKARKTNSKKKIKKNKLENNLNESDALAILSKYTHKKHIKIVERGNYAIFAAILLAKRLNNKAVFLVPDQGGWISFETYPKMTNFFIQKVKTNNGLIDLFDLREKLRLQNASAFIVTSLAGYFAEQEMDKIHELCKQYNCLLIEDASGSISKKLYGDIVVGSFGQWKPVNVGYGGFIAADFSFREIEDFLSTSKTNFNYDLLVGKLKSAKKRIEKFEKKCEQIKQDLKDFDIIHADKKGLNVCIRYTLDAEKDKIIKYCEKKKFEYVLCPKNIRVMDKAISIEVKRME